MHCGLGRDLEEKGSKKNMWNEKGAEIECVVKRTNSRTSVVQRLAFTNQMKELGITKMEVVLLLAIATMSGTHSCEQ